jgi:hypothetical protein
MTLANASIHCALRIRLDNTPSLYAYIMFLAYAPDLCA